MRIGSRIFVVGAVPIATAAFIAVAAILLLGRIDQARTGAAVAGTVYRTLLTAVMARNDYLGAAPPARDAHQRRFFQLAHDARDELDRLRRPRLDDDRMREAEDSLSRFTEDMKRLVAVTVDSDRMVADMGARAATLIGLTDQARERQHNSNADILKSLREDDVKLHAARDIVDAAVATRLALASVSTGTAAVERAGPPTAGDADRELGLAFDVTRLRKDAGELAALLAAGGAARDEGVPVGDDLLPRIETLKSARGPDAAGDAAPARRTLDDVAHWSESVIKVFAALYRSIQEDEAELLNYSVQAHETELATQNIAIEILKLSKRSADALTRRDEGVARAILSTSGRLTDAIASLPISPLIQAEMIEAFRRWPDALRSTTDRVKEQNDIITSMDAASDGMIRAARALDASFGDNADSTARSIQLILVFGAAFCLLLGAGVAFVVARSITLPLRALQTRITRMAHMPDDTVIEDDGRRDELGDIARAANMFLGEIARRERALIKAKGRADSALDTLRRTQAELIQAEKLASLGQLVAGVAHEINTPIGIALTTSTVVDEEARTFRAVAREGRISRAALDRLVERVSEGAGLLTSNLTRAADLIQSFKHVAADQVSGERREFVVATFLHQLLTSLGPMLRKSGCTVSMESADGLTLDSYPGALAQVVTNLVVNASLHAFADGEPGRIAVSAEPLGADQLRVTVADDGCGIAPDHRAKIFDPFFTTRRARGSTGLGLHIVFNLVTGTLGGRIDLQSAPGRGSRFMVDLPRPAAAAPKVPVLEASL